MFLGPRRILPSTGVSNGCGMAFWLTDASTAVVNVIVAEEDARLLGIPHDWIHPSSCLQLGRLSEACIGLAATSAVDVVVFRLVLDDGGIINPSAISFNIAGILNSSSSSTSGAHVAEDIDTSSDDGHGSSVGADDDGVSVIGTDEDGVSTGADDEAVSAGADDDAVAVVADEDGLSIGTDDGAVSVGANVDGVSDGANVDGVFDGAGAAPGLNISAAIDATRRTSSGLTRRRICAKMNTRSPWPQMRLLQRPLHS
ncbi:uncharacterized protein A4U43_C03F28120 [Asparagus officinalis]|uniref:Uncharacterized protein n=1 Tax=Asparagus officinalis TaxID=4686 RepID=A0A5P1FIP7_ASPOF|nr:uncharacterized protein A4U43_C03F28120 [Asparagus officinalis]